MKKSEPIVPWAKDKGLEKINFQTEDMKINSFSKKACLFLICEMSDF